MVIKAWHILLDRFVICHCYLSMLPLGLHSWHCTLWHGAIWYDIIWNDTLSGVFLDISHVNCLSGHGNLNITFHSWCVSLDILLTPVSLLTYKSWNVSPDVSLLTWSKWCGNCYMSLLMCQTRYVTHDIYSWHVTLDINFCVLRVLFCLYYHWFCPR